MQHAATAVTPNPVVDSTHGELGATLRWPQLTRISRWRETNSLIPNPSVTPDRLS